MKRIVISGLILIGLLVAILYLAACGAKTESFGSPPAENATKTSISSILVNPKDYLDKEVVVEGAITSECPAGGWINVRDANGSTIYVEMHGSGFEPIPQRVGKNTVVKGVVYQKEGATKETILLGKGLIIK